MKTSMVRILRPGFVHLTKGGNIITPREEDYIVVPRLSTYGEWPVVMLLPMETLARLSILRDSLAGVKRRKNA